MLTISQIKIDPRINKVARGLAEKGYDVDIICYQYPYHGNEQFVSEEEVYPGVRYVWVQKDPIQRGNLWQYYQYDYFKMCSSRDFDYVHANDFTTLITAWQLASKRGVPLIYDSHEMWSENVWSKKDQWVPMPWWVRKLTGLIEGNICKFVDLFLSVSNSICDEFQRRYKLENRPMLLPNYPELNLLEKSTNPGSTLRETCGLNDDCFVTLYLGGINLLRNIENVIQAHRYLSNRFVFVIQGPGREFYGPTYLKMSSELGLSDRVFILPPVDMDQIVSACRGADCGIVMLQNICKNFYWYYPNKLFEYMLAGLPVAVSNFPDIAALVDKERCGVTFDPDDPKSIAAAIQKLGDNPDQAKAMGKRGSESVVREYNWESTIRQLIEAYNRL
jgi:glycosyltransferase involved in cell wall biosynthesis